MTKSSDLYEFSLADNALSRNKISWKQNIYERDCCEDLIQSLC